MKGTKMQLANMNHAMIEMLRGRVGRCGAAMGGVGSGATSVGVAMPGAVVREGGGGVAEDGMSMAYGDVPCPAYEYGKVAAGTALLRRRD
jgi:phage-related minor tail protein